MAFLCAYGAELLIEIARFWASIATYNSEDDWYDIRGVVGPDEYHTCYPDADTPGIDNNTYTNVMAAWTICRAGDVLNVLPASRRAELWHALALSQDELDQWDAVSRKMRIVFRNGMLSQYEGYEQLQKLDLQQLRAEHGQASIDWHWWRQATMSMAIRWPNKPMWQCCSICSMSLS